MTTATLRIPVLVTPKEKTEITRRAKQFGFSSVGGFLKRAADAYSPLADDDEAAIERMLGEMLKSTEAASRAIDDALAYVDASNLRLAEMEATTQAGRT